MIHTPEWLTWLVPFAHTVGLVIFLVMIVKSWKRVFSENEERAQRKEARTILNEMRKEVRELLNEIRKAILSIEEQAHEYYSKPAAGSETDAMKIKRDLKRLAGMVNILKVLNPKFDLDHQLAEYRRIITGRDFETANRERRTHNDALYVEISDSSLKLAIAMEEMFVSTYRKISENDSSKTQP